MASIAIFVDSLNHGTGGVLHVNGMAYVEGDGDGIPFGADVSFDATAAVQHAAIVDAAVAEVEGTTEFTIGSEDTKTVYGGPAGL
jgi:hypothetical protein